MRTLLVVDAQLVLGEVFDLLDALEHVGIQDLAPVCPVESFDVGVLAQVSLPIARELLQ
mgnify:FL=1